MIKPIRTYINKVDRKPLFYDASADTETLRKVCNELIDKVNELTTEVNALRAEKEKASDRYMKSNIRR